MKSKLRTIITASAASLVTLSALAQVPSHAPTAPPDSVRQAAAHARADRLNGAVKASDLLGMTVHNYQNEKLGKVDDLAVDVESGRLLQVILSTGGFIGIGDTLTALPPGALHHDPAQKLLHLDADKEKLKRAPRFETAKWAEASDPDHLTGVYRYYGEESALTFIQTGDAAPAGRHLIPAARLGQVQQASKLLGTPVLNLQDEKLGKVENLLLDLAAGRVVAVVVSSGGFLGMGDELSAVPPTVLRFSPERDTLRLDATKERLSAAPHFQANQWPEFGQPSYAGGVYRAYQVEPYFTFDTTTDADNTRINARDRDDRTLTPLDQGQSAADVATTARIRKDILADKTMSVNARNVKIITNGGQVTLRGPVNTAEEKRLIGEIAERSPHSGTVDNQLEVKVTVTRND